MIFLNIILIGVLGNYASVNAGKVLYKFPNLENFISYADEQ